jgi:hypothetical protein
MHKHTVGDLGTLAMNGATSYSYVKPIDNRTPTRSARGSLILDQRGDVQIWAFCGREARTGITG